MRTGINNPAPRTRFDLPPDPPKQVRPFVETFERLGLEWARVARELEDAREAAEAATRAAVAEAADALLAGRARVDVVAVEAEHQARIAALERGFEVAALAVGRAGDEMADAIDANRDEWRRSLTASAEKASAAYERAVDEALAAFEVLQRARGAVAWLDAFDAAEARVGAGQVQFAGGRIRVQHRQQGPYPGDHDPRDLLRIARRATEEARGLEPDKRDVVVEDEQVAARRRQVVAS